ncbi:hypothetical protein K8F61_17210 [Microbacterium resistens]|uniref:Uncharacterized protein n=1 Tax=Microbacterium resistens TaxID=156977 RepID=A0ABY3RQH9_9MICO|nr:hypothetical protein [Microbacterium resistens]UGS26343.1 hypothetical protein K8F61_17210 [Microbacterium resistens]
MNGYETKAELGHDWIRTERTVEALDTIRDLHDMQSFADDVNATVLDNAGQQIVMQVNGWAVIPAGQHAQEAADLIDRAVEALDAPGV